MPRHLRQHDFRLRHPAAERHHHQQVGKTHLRAHPAQCGALERETLGIGRMRIARRTTEAEHRVSFVRLERGTADQRGVFVGLEVRQPHDHWLRIKRSGDGANPFGERANEELAR